MSHTDTCAPARVVCGELPGAFAIHVVSVFDDAGHVWEEREFGSPFDAHQWAASWWPLPVTDDPLAAAADDVYFPDGYTADDLRGEGAPPLTSEQRISALRVALGTVKAMDHRLVIGAMLAEEEEIARMYGPEAAVRPDLAY